MNLESWMIERDCAEWNIHSGTNIASYWKQVQEEAEQEIERILRA